MSTIDRLISTLVPHDCVGCGYEGRIICVQCAAYFEKIPGRCYRCRKETQAFRVCADCRTVSSLHAVIPAVVYRGTAKDLVWHLKFQGVQAAAKSMAVLMRQALPPGTGIRIVPVPTATGRSRRRGYDQAKLLSRELSKVSRLPHLDCLRRSGQTHQVGANRQERLQQLQRAFYIRHHADVRGQDVMLVDDIVTTGATLEAAAAALKGAGVRSISAIVFAQPPLVLGDTTRK